MPSADNPSESNLHIVSGILIAASILWCIYWFVHAWHYWEDDAWIHLEFARSLAAGRGFAFNGRVVAGDTAPLWVFLLAGMHAIIPNWIIGGKVLTVLGATLGLTGAYAFARKMAASLFPSSVAQIFPAAMVVLIVANPYSCYWIFSGMEPFAASGLAFFAVLSATRDRPTTTSFLTACLLAGIAPLLRPEMIFFTALLVLPLLAQVYKLPSKPAAFIAGLFLLCGPIAAWSLYSLRAFGHLLPNTNAAKRAAPTDSVLHRLLSIYSIGFPLIVCGVLVGIIYLILRFPAVRHSFQNAITSAFTRNSQRQPNLPLAAWIFILWPAIATVFYVADHTYVQTRYILVTAPALTIVIMALFLQVSERTGRVLYVASLAAALAISVATTRPFIRNKALNCQVMQGFALFIRNHIPPDAPVAVYGIGQVAFISEHPIIDTGGITRPGVIPYLNSPPDMLRWAKSEGAQYIIDDHQPEPGATSVYSAELPFIGWTLKTARYTTSAPTELWRLTSATEQPLPPLNSASAKP